MNRCKKYTETSWMKLLNWCKKYRNKSVQLIITNIRHTHAPLQLCSVTLKFQITICNDIDGEHNYGATLQSCSGAWVWRILVIIGCTDLFLYFYTCSAISANLSPYFYTCSTLYLFWENFYMSSFTPFLNVL